MELYLNYPLRSGRVVCLTDPLNVYRRLEKTRFKLYPEKATEVPDKIAEQLLDEVKTRKGVYLVSKEPFDGEWPEENQKPDGMQVRRRRAGELRPEQRAPDRLPANMERTNYAFAEEPKHPGKDDPPNAELAPNKFEGFEERFKRLRPERNDRKASMKLKSLADKDFSLLLPMELGVAVKALGFKFTSGLSVADRQEALEDICKIVAKEVKSTE